MIGKKSGVRAYRGLIIDVDVDEVQLPSGVVCRLEIIRHPGAAAVVPLHADGTVTLLRQYRYAVGGFIYEVPAGKLEADETPESCALREVREEAGLAAARLVPLGPLLTTPGFTDEVIHLFAAVGLTEQESSPEEDEVLEVLRLPLAEALGWCAEGRIQDGKSMCALLRADQEIRAGRLAIDG